MEKSNHNFKFQLNTTLRKWTHDIRNYTMLTLCLVDAMSSSNAQYNIDSQWHKMTMQAGVEPTYLL